MNKRKWLLALTGVATVIILTFGSVAVYAHGPQGYEFDSEDGFQWSEDSLRGLAGGFCYSGYGLAGNYLTHPVSLARLADTIGITYEELTTELVAGKTIAEIGEIHGVATDALINGILEPYSENIQARVAAGYLTTEEAADIIEQAQVTVTTQLTTPRYTTTTPATGETDGWRYNRGIRWGRGCFR